jgi:ribonuclease HI
LTRSPAIVIEADGASRGNPGLAGAGVVIRDADGHKLETVAKFLGTGTNNQAEYRALIEGLQAAPKHNPSSITVRMDSELVIKHMTGEYRVRNPQLIPLYSQVHELLANLPTTTFQLVPRERNKEADKAANLAVDSRGRRTGGSDTDALG